MLVEGDRKFVVNYTAFGMTQPERSFDTSSYRFAFGGKETIDELYENSNAYDFGARIQDPRLGRWLSVDKKFRDAPFFTPYIFGANNPIIYIDPDGNTEFYFNGKWIASDGKINGMIGIVTSEKVKGQIENSNYPSEIENGKAFKGGFALHIEVLRESNEVLNRAFKVANEGILREQTSVMNKTESGYETTRGEGTDYSEIDNKARAPVQAGDVGIHSHLVNEELDVNNCMASGFDANEPSPPSGKYEGDKRVFENFNTNIIVGKGGQPNSIAKIETNLLGQKIMTDCKLEERPAVINVFDSKSKMVGTINKEEAILILQNENNRKK